MIRAESTCSVCRNHCLEGESRRWRDGNCIPGDTEEAVWVLKKLHEALARTESVMVL